MTRDKDSTTREKAWWSGDDLWLCHHVNGKGNWCHSRKDMNCRHCGSPQPPIVETERFTARYAAPKTNTGVDEAADEIAALRKERDAALLRCKEIDCGGGLAGCNNVVLKCQMCTQADYWKKHNQDLKLERDAALKSLDVAMREVAAWRNHAEDSHDTNYGFCRPGCTKCESKKAAWAISKATDADPLCAATLARIRHEPPHP